MQRHEWECEAMQTSVVTFGRGRARQRKWSPELKNMLGRESSLWADPGDSAVFDTQRADVAALGQM